MRVILAVDGLNPMELPFRIGLPAATGPAPLLALLGLSALAVELAMVSMLFSARMRWVMPAAMLATHVGIALLQNVLFADLMVLLVAFYAQRWTDQCSPGRNVHLAEGILTPRVAVGAHAAGRSTGPRVFAAFASAFILANLAGVEFYPLTGMQMYSRRNHDGIARYHRIVTIDSEGHEEAAHPERWVGALRDSRYRFHLHRCFDEAGRAPCREFLSWSIRDRPTDPDHGAIHARVRVPVE